MVISVNDYEKSSTYRFINDVIEITEPLNKLGVIYFIYAELTGCYYISCLVNNDQMIRDFINYNGLKYELALSPYKIINEGLYAVSAIPKSKGIKDYYERMFALSKASDQIIYIADHQKVRRVYIFGVLDSLYINKEYLELFILYFNDHAAYLINQTEHLKIPKEFIEDHPAPVLKTKNFIFAEMEQEFLDSINAKYYKIKRLQEQYSLSGREVQCLELILQNKITKQIANFLHLTTRTAETYIDNLKKKLNCHTKNEIMVKFFVK